MNRADRRRQERATRKMATPVLKEQVDDKLNAYTKLVYAGAHATGFGQGFTECVALACAALCQNMGFGPKRINKFIESLETFREQMATGALTMEAVAEYLSKKAKIEVIETQEANHEKEA